MLWFKMCPILTVFVAAYFICVCDGWRRRRRVVGLADSEMRRKRSAPVERSASCQLHGEYLIKDGKIVPADKQRTLRKKIYCNNERCWSGTYCWECRLRSATDNYEAVAKDKIKDLICKDVQCLLGKVDVGLSYYSTNDSRSMPLAKSPFYCNDYLCMSTKKCWKCRLNRDSINYETIPTEQEFNRRVTCCPLPKKILSIQIELKGPERHSNKHSSRDADSNESDEDYELNEHEEDDQSIDFDLNARKLITGIKLHHEKVPARVSFTVSYSNDGSRWIDYVEYNRKAIFYSTSANTRKFRTLFKPIAARYVMISPKNVAKRSQYTVEISGCDMLVN